MGPPRTIPPSSSSSSKKGSEKGLKVGSKQCGKGCPKTKEAVKTTATTDASTVLVNTDILSSSSTGITGIYQSPQTKQASQGDHSVVQSKPQHPSSTATLVTPASRCNDGSKFTESFSSSSLPRFSVVSVKARCIPGNQLNLFPLQMDIDDTSSDEEEDYVYQYDDDDDDVETWVEDYDDVWGWISHRHNYTPTYICNHNNKQQVLTYINPTQKLIHSLLTLIWPIIATFLTYYISDSYLCIYFSNTYAFISMPNACEFHLNWCKHVIRHITMIWRRVTITTWLLHHRSFKILV